MKFRNKNLTLLFLLFFKFNILFSQVNKLKQELSAGGNVTFINDLVVNDLLTTQNFPEIGNVFAGTHLNYRVHSKKFIYGANVISAFSNNNKNGFQNKSIVSSFGLSAFYPIYNSSFNNLYFGLSASASVFHTSIIGNQVQDLKYLYFDRVTFYNNNWTGAAKLLYYMFATSNFPLILELCYDVGLSNKWKNENAAFLNNSSNENFNRFTVSIDIPIIRTK